MKNLSEGKLSAIKLKIGFKEKSSTTVECHFYMPIEDDGLDLYTCQNGALRRTAMYSGVISVQEVTA